MCNLILRYLYYFSMLSLIFKASSIFGGNEICSQAHHNDIDVSYGNIVCKWSLHNLKPYFIDAVIDNVPSLYN